MAKASKPAPKYRDADSGQYVTKKYADNHPKTTVKETDKPKKKMQVSKGRNCGLLV